jgi:hypothetical protein
MDLGRALLRAGCVHDGKDIIQLKVLSDRRAEGGGIAWLVRFTPPPGKLIKIVATALPTSTSSVCRAAAAPRAARRPKGRRLRPQSRGQPHSAMIAQETMALVIYAGEPDRIDSLEVVDVG